MMGTLFINFAQNARAGSYGNLTNSKVEEFKAGTY